MAVVGPGALGRVFAARLSRVAPTALGGRARQGPRHRGGRTGGGRGGRGGRAQPAERLTAAGLPAEATPEAAARRLEKLAVNLVVNPLTAVLDLPNGGLLDPELWATVRDLVLEMHPVLAARGPLPDAEELLARIRAVLTATAANTSSMRADVRAGRPSEIEELTGVLLAWARAGGRALPRHEALYRMVRALEQVHRGEPLEE